MVLVFVACAAACADGAQATATSSILGRTGANPRAIAVDAAGNVYTANESANSVTKITPAGVSTTLVQMAAGTSPWAITVDSVGNVYTANSGTNNVTKILPDGTIAFLGPTGTNPEGIVVDAEGNIYTANAGSDNVSMITALGTASILAGTASGPDAITIDTKGNLWTNNSSSGSFTRITRPPWVSTLTTNVGGGQRSSLVVNSAGYVYGTRPNTQDIVVAVPGGGFGYSGAFTSNQVTGSTPSAIATDSSNILYTANFGSNNVSRIATSTTPGQWYGYMDTPTELATTGSGPIAIAVDAAGNVYTANYYSNNVSKISPGGNASTLGSTGAEPSSLTIDTAGNVFTANSSASSISKITASGVSTTLANLPANANPVGIAIDQSGNLFTANRGSASVSKVTAAGSVVGSPWPANAGGAPSALALDQAGNIFVTNDSYDTVAKVTAAGAVLGSPWPAAAGADPSGVAVDSSGNAYTSNSGASANNVSKITPSGSSTVLGSVLGATPNDIAVDGAGNVYTPNLGDDNVTKITPTGNSSTLGSTGDAPWAIALDLIGNVYTANAGSNTVTKITPGGVAVPLAATGTSPYAVSVDSAGNVYTANNGSSSVTKITPDSYAAAPATPGAPSATAGHGSATVTVPVNAASAAYGAPSAYTFKAAEDPTKSCTASVTPSIQASPASCTVTGLTNGNSYTFTAQASLGNWTSAASAASSSVTPNSVPDAPSALAAAPHDGSATIAFTPGAANGSAITNYEYSLSGGAWIALSPTDATSPVTIPGLTNGTIYAVRLRAVNAVGVSPTSLAVTVTPATTAAAPTGLTAAAGNTAAWISFTPGSANGSPITNYKFSTDNGGSWTAISPADTTSPVKITGLSNGTTYQVRLRAVNGQGDGTVSDAVSVTPAAVPDEPTALVATALDGSARIAFTPGANNGSAITNYEYSLGGGAWAALDPSDTTSPVTIPALTNGTTYSVRLRAISSVGAGAASDPPVSVTPATTPAAPTALEALPADSSAIISFTAGADNGRPITNYEYQYSTDSGTTWTLWNVLSPADPTSPVTIPNLANGTAYQVRIRAVNSFGLGAQSFAVSVTPAATPSAPTALAATPSNGGTQIWFTPGSNNGSSITNYQYSTNNGRSWTALTPAEESSPVTIDGLTNGTSYAVNLRAVNSEGSGPSSAAVSVTPASTPAAPTRLVATAGDESISVAFTPGSDNGSGITNYQYSLNSGSSWSYNSAPTTASPFVITGLTNGKAYSVILRAVNTQGAGASSSSVDATPSKAPGAPTNLASKPASSAAVISFTPGADNGSAITNYEYAIDGGAWAALSPAKGTSPIAITHLTNGKSYKIEIRAISAVGVSAPSDAVNAAAAPARPTVSWSSSSRGRTVTALITPITRLTYTLTAKRARTGRTGSCKNVTIRQGKKTATRRSCTVKLPPGTWIANVTPKLENVAGTVNTRRFKFK